MANLVLRWSLDDGSPAPEETDQVLLKGVDELEIAYLDARGPGSPAGAPTGSIRPPPPTRHTSSGRPSRTGDPRVWPEMIVRPAARVDTLCVLEPATGLCRGRQ